MKSWNIPETFRLVDLSDYTTWHYASIQDWFAMRNNIVGKTLSSKEQNKVNRALKKAISEFKRGKGSAFDIKLIHHSGRYVAEIQKLFRNHLNADSYVWRNCSAWELEFLRASQWIQYAQEHYYNDDKTGITIRTLLEMCSQKDLQLHEYKTEERKLKKGSVSSTAGIGLPGGKNAYLPDSIELMQLYRLACLVAIELKPKITNAQNLKLKTDKYGSAFPCRKCRIKYDYAIFAEMCCHTEYSKEKRDQYFNSIPVGSAGLRKHLCALLDLLWKLGYDTPTSLEDLLKWSGWETISKIAEGEFAHNLLGCIFKSSPETVRRKLAHSDLKRKYKKYGIPSRLWDFKNKSTFGKHAELRPPHWYNDEISDSNSSALLKGKRIIVLKWPYGFSNKYDLARFIIPESKKSLDG